MSRRFSDFTGSVSEVVSAKDMFEVAGFENDNYYCNCGNNILITATLLDKNSNEVQEAQKLVNIKDTRYNIKWLYEPPMARPDVGLQYIGQVNI